MAKWIMRLAIFSLFVTLIHFMNPLHASKIPDWAVSLVSKTGLFGDSETEADAYQDESFQASWMHDGDPEYQDCSTYSWCAHIRLESLQICPVEITINFEVLDSEDFLVDAGTVMLSNKTTSKLEVVEIGTDLAADFSWFTVSSISCGLQEIYAL